MIRMTELITFSCVIQNYEVIYDFINYYDSVNNRNDVEGAMIAQSIISSKHSRHNFLWIPIHQL